MPRRTLPSMSAAPSVKTDLPSDALVLGLDLGGSSVKAVLVTVEGAARARYHEVFEPDRRLHFAETIRDVVQRAARECGGRLAGIGLSAPGLAARDGRSIAFMPGRLEGLVGLDWAEYLDFHAPIPVLNDAHAALLGEVWQGAARGCRDVIMLTLGTGVGGAAMVDGRLLRGHTGKAGHLGHTCLDVNGAPDICGTPGSLELAIGNCTIRERSGGRFNTTHELIAAHRAGDPHATEVWMKSLRALACAIGTFTNLFDPEVVVIGGGIARAGQALFEPLEPLIRTVEWRTGPPVRLAPAQLGEFAGAFGAARHAWELSCDALQTPGRKAVE
jgi:glucokinase